MLYPKYWLIGLASLAAACPPPNSFMVLPDGRVHGNPPRDILEKLTNGTSGFDRRGMRAIPGENGDGALWANNVIPFCIDPTLDANTRQVVEDSLISAWGLWTTAGVRGLVFRTGTAAECAAGSGTSTLRVQISTIKMSTSIGMDLGGGSMTLVMDEVFGLGDRVANFAHEIGQ